MLFRSDWKELIVKFAPELLAYLATQAFEGSFETKKAINYGFEIEVAMNGDG